jgi:uncharacterized membrane protein YbhN (UPF0104 family)
MKIALSADLHLGIRQFNNKQRWQDYLDAYNKLTKKVKQLQVDAFVIAGDIFNKSRPHPGIVRKFLKETSKVDCPVMLIRGNHDSPQILFEKYGGDILHLINDVSKIVYLKILVVSIIGQILIIVKAYFLALALGIEVSLTYMFLVVPIAIILSMLPSINGIGFRDGAYVILLAKIGVSKAAALSLSFLALFIPILISIAGGILFMLQKKVVREKEVEIVEKSVP